MHRSLAQQVATDEYNRLQRMTDQELIREYKQGLRDCFSHNLFCNNARHWFNLVVRTLRDRGIKEYQDIFGVVEIKEWRS